MRHSRLIHFQLSDRLVIVRDVSEKMIVNIEKLEESRYIQNKIEQMRA